MNCQQFKRVGVEIKDNWNVNVFTVDYGKLPYNAQQKQSNNGSMEFEQWYVGQNTKLKTLIIDVITNLIYNT